MQNKHGGIGKELIEFFKDSLIEINPRNNFSDIFSNWKLDLMAGITVAFIALPLALAFGVGSGLGAMAGLWGAIAGGLIASLFGGSKIGVSGPTGPMMAQVSVLLVGFQLADGTPNLFFAFSVVFLSGCLLILFSFLKIGRLIYYTPYSVIAGFMCGIGALVILLEINPLVGLPNEKSIKDVLINLPKTFQNMNPDALFLSGGTFFILLIYGKIASGVRFLKNIPAPLFALIIGSIAASFLKLNVGVIENIPLGLPKIYLPGFSEYSFSQYLTPALSLAGLAIFDSLLTCLVNDNMSGDTHSSDRELFGQGLSNMVSGLIGGLTTATATMRSVALYKSGGRTVLGSFVHGFVLLMFAVFLGPLASMIPLPCLAAILLKVGIDIVDYRVIPILHRLPGSDLVIFLVVFIVTVVEDLLFAMGIGMALACFRFVQEMSKVYNYQVEKQEVSELEISEKSFIYAPRGPLFFGSVKNLGKLLDQIEDRSKVVIDLSQVVFIDLSGAFALDDGIKKLRQRNIKVELRSPNHDINRVLEKLKLFKSWEENFEAELNL